MKRRALILIVPAIAMVAAFASTDAVAQPFDFSIHPKAKAKKVQAELVRAATCGGAATDPVDCDGTTLAVGSYDSACGFTKGKIKIQLGKDAAVFMPSGTGLGAGCGMPCSFCSL